ncbi:MAG TPA: DGQHR domain-containing protein [Candidatus Hodarchaeales archaeon]|nr:DGQHR domain-containing protein [Candidatus Hodarchaeales archaeon]
MLDNIDIVDNLRGLARAKGRDYETKTVHPTIVEELLSKGWSEDKKHKMSVRLKRKKSHNAHLEDRVWSLLYRMGFGHLSGEGGATLLVNPKEADSPKTQIDVVGIDDEIAVAIECKSTEKPSRRPQFQEELGKHTLIRERFSNSVNKQYAAPFKRQVVLAMFISNISLSENDKARAKEANVMLFEEQDLNYYESLVSHLGPAAKYQFLADMLPGKPIPGLAIRVPAIKTKMGGSNCYTFSISPEYLLKISYVSHRSKGKASDVDTYQRMLRKSRLNQIRQYISNDGIFPTSIVVNLDGKRLQFERIHQKTDPKTDQGSGLLGWLDIRPAYKSAWIIDGQHRLFAYSGHEKAPNTRLSVLAFEGLLPSKQAELFIDINSKQKSVQRSLLQELYAELHWDAEEPKFRVRAIVSKAIHVLGADPESALYQRIQTADVAKDPTRCITFTSVHGAIDKPGFYIAKERHGNVLEYGPLWAGDNEATLKRTVYVLNNWLNTIRAGAFDWWNKGSGEGGGLAMNDGVATCVNMLRSVFQYLDKDGQKLVHLDNEDLFNCVKDYAGVLGDYFGSLSEEDRRRFRDLRGIQGQTTRRRRCEQAIRERFPSFNPPGLEEFLKLEKAQTNSKAKEIIDRIETTLQKVVLEELRRQFGSDESQWWMLGVPKLVRLKVTQRFEEDDGKRGGKEYYFDLIDYKQIALNNWELFESILAYAKTGNKDKRTSWMNVLNEKRKIVSHASSAVSLSLEDLSELQDYDKWLSERIVGTQDYPKNESADQ